MHTVHSQKQTTNIDLHLWLPAHSTTHLLSNYTWMNTLPLIILHMECFVAYIVERYQHVKCMNFTHQQSDQQVQTSWNILGLPRSLNLLNSLLSKKGKGVRKFKPSRVPVFQQFGVGN